MAIDQRATRLGVLGLVGVILFSLIGVRLWFLQTVKADELQELSTAAKTRTVPLLPERGRIFDVDGRILADNQRILTVAVDWQLLRKRTDRDEIFRRLSAGSACRSRTMEARFDAKIDSPFLPMPIAGDVDEPTAPALLERVEDFPGVPISRSGSASIRTRRTPPTSSATWARSPRSRRTSTSARLPAERAGRPVRRREEHGVGAARHVGQARLRGRRRQPPVRLIEDVPPINGFDVQLTIDLDYQQYAEQALETTLEVRRTQLAPNPKVAKPERPAREDGSGASRRGVRTRLPPGRGHRDGLHQRQHHRHGELPDVRQPLVRGRPVERRSSSRSSRPTPDGTRSTRPVDPRQPRHPGPLQPGLDVQAVHRLRRAQHRADLGRRLLQRRRRRTACTASTRTAATPGSCDASTRTPPAPARSAPCRYGQVNVDDALAVSSDSFFYRIGEEIMVRNDFEPVLQEQVELFGFGADTGIDLPFEFDGTVPDKELKNALRRARRHQRGRGPTATSPATTCSWRSDRVCCRRRRCSSPSATRRSPTGASCSSPRSCKAIWNPGVPDGEPGCGRLSTAARSTSRSTGRSWSARSRCRARSATADRRRACGGVVTTGAGVDVRLLPHDHRREPVLRLPGRGDPDRRQDRHRPGRQQLPVERLVGVHRVQPRRDAARTS